MSTEYIVIEKSENVPDGHKALGIGVACAIFFKKSEALRWQLKNGKTNSTEIMVG